MVTWCKPILIKEIFFVVNYVGLVYWFGFWLQIRVCQKSEIQRSSNIMWLFIISGSKQPLFSPGWYKVQKGLFENQAAHAMVFTDGPNAEKAKGLKLVC